MKISKYLVAFTSLILLLNPIISMTIRSSSEALSMYELCFSSERTGSKTERANLKQFAKRGKQNWPKNTYLVDTEIVKRSNKGICAGSDCRGWLESKILAFCKANLLASKLDKSTFNLVQVLYKSEAKGEYSQYLFSTESGKNIMAGSNEFNSKLLYR